LAQLLYARDCVRSTFVSKSHYESRDTGGSVFSSESGHCGLREAGVIGDLDNNVAISVPRPQVRSRLVEKAGKFQAYNDLPASHKAAERSGDSARRDLARWCIGGTGLFIVYRVETGLVGRHMHEFGHGSLSYV